MISAIVTAPDTLLRRTDAREVVVRSLAWLVSAVVAGVVRDVVLTAAPDMDLGDIADHLGCDLVQAADGNERLRLSAGRTRCAQALVIQAGYFPTGPLADELEVRSRSSPDRPALLLAAPTGFIQNLMPNRTPVVGILTPKTRLLAATSFEDLVRASRGVARLETRAGAFA